MALSKRSAQTIKVVALADDSVNCSREVYDLYLISLDEALLQLEGEPTRFVVRTVLPYDLQQKLDNDKVKMDAARNMQIATSSLPEARAILVGIEAPSTQSAEDRIEFKKDSDGLASKDLVTELNANGICADLVTARSNSISAKPSVEKK